MKENVKTGSVLLRAAAVIAVAAWFGFNYVLLVASGIGDQPREVSAWEGRSFFAGLVVLCIGALGALLGASWARMAVYLALVLGSGPLLIGTLF